MVWVGRDLADHLVPIPPAMDRDTFQYTSLLWYFRSVVGELITFSRKNVFPSVYQGACAWRIPTWKVL